MKKMATQDTVTEMRVPDALKKLKARRTDLIYAPMLDAESEASYRTGLGFSIILYDDGTWGFVQDGAL